MKGSLFQNSTIWVLFATLFVAVGLGWITRDVEETLRYSLLLCGGVILVGTLFFAFNWYYLLAIGLIPISVDMGVLGGAQINFPSEGLLVLSLPVLLLFNVRYRKTLNELLRHPITMLLVADILLGLFTSLAGTHVDVSLKRLLIRVIFISGFYVIFAMIKDKNKLHQPWLFYILGLIPVMFFTLKSHAHYSFNPRVVFNICAPYFNDHTIYGACIAFILPLTLIALSHLKRFEMKNWLKVCAIVLMIILIASEILALSRASILSLGVALGFYLLLRYNVQFRTIILSLIVLISVGYSVKDTLYNSIKDNEAVSNDGEISNHFSSVTNIKSDASNLERINRWVCAWRMFEERPLLGYGPGTYQFEYNQFQTLANKTYISTNLGNRGNAHSEYLTYLSEMGIIGLIIFILTIFSTIYFGMQNHYGVEDYYLKLLNLGVLLGLVTFFFHGIMNSFIDQSKMAFLYYTGLATIVVINQRMKKSISESA